MKMSKWFFWTLVPVGAIVLAVLWVLIPPKAVRDAASNIKIDKMEEVYTHASKIYQTIHEVEAHDGILREIIETDNLKILREKSTWKLIGNISNGNVVLKFEKTKGKFVLSSGEVELEGGQTIDFEQYLLMKTSDVVANQVIKALLLRDYKYLTNLFDTEIPVDDIVPYLSVNCKGMYAFNTKYELDANIIIIDELHFQRSIKLISNEQTVGIVKLLFNYNDAKILSGIKVLQSSNYVTYIPNEMKEEVVKLMDSVSSFKLQSTNVEDQLFLKAVDQKEIENTSHFRIVDLKIYPDGKLKKLGEIKFELPIDETQKEGGVLISRDVSKDFLWKKTVFSQAYGITLDYYVKSELENLSNDLYVKIFDDNGIPIIEMKIKSHYENYSIF